jgi:hypothetical protein
MINININNTVTRYDWCYNYNNKTEKYIIYIYIYIIQAFFNNVSGVNKIKGKSHVTYKGTLTKDL